MDAGAEKAGQDKDLMENKLPQQGGEGRELRYYVGIGASAGGVEALQELFQNMPDDTGASFIVVQHLSPDAVSMMDKILRKTSNMPVRLAEEGLCPLPNEIYLNVPGMTLTLREGRLHLEEAQNHNQLYLPINLMLNSLSAEEHAHTVAVILSGSGSDGAIGVGAIKESGGLVIAQKPMEAQYASMPKSAIDTGMVDLTKNVAQIGAVIRDYFKSPAIQYIGQEDILDCAELAEDFERIVDAVSRYSNIDFTSYKSNTIFRRIERRTAIHKLNSVGEYLDYILSSEDEKELLCKDLLIGVTSFFRDLEAFKSLADKIIIPLMKAQKDIRLWSIACSTGEEAYSLAILICECMAALKINVEVKLFATDVEQSSIAFAQKGIYQPIALSNVDEAIVDKYFVTTENGYMVSERIRRMIVFARHDIFRDAPFSKLDLIICRNMFIYIKPEMQQKILGNFYQLLNESGYLFLGSSESLGEVDGSFHLLDKKWKLYKKDKTHPPKEAGFFFLNAPGEGKKEEPGQLGTLRSKLRTVNLSEKILFLMAGPSVLVDGYGKIIQIIQGGGKYLRLQDGQFDNGIASCFNSGLTVLITRMMDQLKKEDGSVLEKSAVGIEDYSGDLLRIRIQRFALDAGDYFLIQIGSEPPREKPERAGGEEIDLRGLKDSRIKELERELNESNWNLKLAVEESESRNEELQATNEELLASNEELQSTNEEMQSVNEELYTINAEYQNKIVELTTANADFDNLLLNAEVGALYIDGKLCIRKITPIVLQNTNLMAKDLERSITQINFLDSYPEFTEDVRTVVRENRVIEKEITDENNVIWLIRIRPYSDHVQDTGGVLVTMFDITKRLEAAKFELKNLTDSVPGGVLRLHYDGDLVLDYANDSFYAMVGYSAGEVKDRYHNRFHRLLEQDDWAELSGKLTRTEWSGQTFKTECRIRRRDGARRWVSMQAVLFQSGRRLELQCILTDITLIKDYEQQLRRERDYYNALYQNVVCGIVQYEAGDDTLQCYNANEEAVRMLGCSSLEEFRAQGAQTMCEVTARQGVVRMRELMLTLREVGQSVNFEHSVRRADGTEGWLSGTAKVVSTPEGKKLIQSTFMDITDEKRALERLKKECSQYDQLYNMLYNMAICGIVQVEMASHTVLNVNREALRLLRKDGGRAVEKALFSGAGGAEAELAEIGALLHTLDGETRRKSFRLDLPDRPGGHISIECSANWIMGEENTKIVQITLLDVTERERLKEAEMRLAVATRSNETKSAFLSKMSHEIRTPMNGIMGMIDSAHLYLNDQEKVRSCLEKMRASMLRLQDLVDNVLDMSKIKSGGLELEDFDLSVLLNDAVEEFSYVAQKRGVGLSLAGSCTHTKVRSDPGRLRDVLGNLISNAVKFTEAAGYVVLIVEEAEQPGQDPEFTFRVKDTGCGISPENQAEIFEAFEQIGAKRTYHNDGSGLGLTISKHLVEMLGGELRVKSQQGQGSEFSFTIPMKAVEDGERACPPCQDAAPHQRRILLVEDNELNMEIAKNLLEACHYATDSVWNGREALDRFLSQPARTYDLILMDIQMPVMGGFEAAKRIRACGKEDAADIPILAMSADAFIEDVQQALRSGMNGHIAKPIDIQLLVQQIRHFLPEGDGAEE